MPGLIGLILGVIAIGAAFAGPFAFAAWIFALPALVLGLVGASRSQDRNGLPIAALVTSVTAIVVSVAVLVGYYVFTTSKSDSVQAEPDLTTSGDSVFDLDADGPESAGLTVHEVGETWVWDSSWSGQQGTVWDITIHGLVELPFVEWSPTEDGRCYAIVGTMTPTAIEGGALETSLLDVPLAGLYVDDVLVEDFGYCELDSLAAAGYESIYAAAVPLGSEYPFFVTKLVPDSYGLSGDIQFIWVGGYQDTRAGLVEPVFIELP
ncbi:MAG: hypothetical protein CVT64_00690 [Actinobacteria bacterium HGW-Actinobacteria-4]|nr:MAG: hypothetical protein CVT64_00690 [Actinobacteria bacterium HGW-Actinobacteria-4]